MASPVASYHLVSGSAPGSVKIVRENVGNPAQTQGGVTFFMRDSMLIARISSTESREIITTNRVFIKKENLLTSQNDLPIERREAIFSRLCKDDVRMFIKYDNDIPRLILQTSTEEGPVEICYKHNMRTGEFELASSDEHSDGKLEIRLDDEGYFQVNMLNHDRIIPIENIRFQRGPEQKPKNVNIETESTRRRIFRSLFTNLCPGGRVELYYKTTRKGASILTIKQSAPLESVESKEDNVERLGKIVGSLESIRGIPSMSVLTKREDDDPRYDDPIVELCISMKGENLIFQYTAVHFEKQPDLNLHPLELVLKNGDRQQFPLNQLAEGHKKMIAEKILEEKILVVIKKIRSLNYDIYFFAREGDPDLQEVVNVLQNYGMESLEPDAWLFPDYLSDVLSRKLVRSQKVSEI